jgi:phospholipid transport system substrate-binding protein
MTKYAIPPCQKENCRHVSRRAILGLTLACLVVAVPRRGRALHTAPAAAPASAPAAAPPSAQTPTQVVAPIQALNDRLIAVMRAGKPVSFRDRFHILAPAVDRAFDLTAVLRTSVGLHWGDLEAAQQASLLTVFRRFTVASYVANFDSYDGERFEIAPALRSIGADQVVNTNLVPADNGEAIRIDYVMRQEAGAWKIIDVLLDGTISRVAVQRSDFRGVLAQGGAPALIASLERKVVDLGGSALES